jgi:hypothetical protein
MAGAAVLAGSRVLGHHRFSNHDVGDVLRGSVVSFHDGPYAQEIMDEREELQSPGLVIAIPIKAALYCVDFPLRTETMNAGNIGLSVSANHSCASSCALSEA